MSLFNKVLGTIFEEEPQPSSNEGVSSVTTPAKVVAAPIDDKTAAFVSKLTEAAYARNTAFKTVLDATEKTKDIIPDEAMRIKAALATLTGESRTSASILQAIEIHLQDLTSEKTKFYTAAESNKAAEKNALNSKISEGERVSAQLKTDIATLEASIQDKKALLAQCDQNVADAKASQASIDSSFQLVTFSFDSAFERVTQDLLSKKSIFNSALKGK